MYKLVSNKIRCKFCGDVIESRSVHDFVRCKCGKCFTDGGLEYVRRGFDGDKPEDVYQDLSTYLDENGRLVEAKVANQADIPSGIEAGTPKKDEPVYEAPKTDDISANVDYPHKGLFEVPETKPDIPKEVTEERSDEPRKFKKEQPKAHGISFNSEEL